jgi:ParB family chromosome partitioning protein
VQSLPSAERFKALISHLKPARAARGIPQVLSTPDGARLAQVSQSKSKLEITIDRKATPDFAAFVLEHLPALYQEYRHKDQRNNGE